MEVLSQGVHKVTLMFLQQGDQGLQLGQPEAVLGRAA